MNESKTFKKKPHAALKRLLAERKISLNSIARLYGRSDVWAQSFIKDPCKISLREFYMLAGFMSVPTVQLLEVLATTDTGGSTQSEPKDKPTFGK